MAGEFRIQRAEPSQKDELLELLNTGFSSTAMKFDFLKTHPYLFHQDRIGNHFICMDGGRIIGNIGVYTWDVRVGGEVFRAAGIGQVCCMAEYRGRGVMSSILKHICTDVDEQGLDFSWLYGDRLRYGRYGWVKGGKTLNFRMFDKYLPEPPDETAVRILDPEKDTALVRKHFSSLYVMQCLTDRDIRELTARNGFTGYVLGTSFIIADTGSDTVHFASGGADEIALLLAHYGRELRKREGDFWKFRVSTGSARTPLMRVCERSYWQVDAEPCAMFRTGPLLPFMEKVCRIRTGSIPLAGAELAIGNKDTGEKVTLVCDDLSLTVREGAENPVMLNTRELSEVCFGWCPVDLFLPSLPANSPFRSVFPFHFHLPKFLAL
jgi:predicted N-acetyltransferase YhbS